MKLDIVRAWKDEAYRQTLSQEELNILPPSPAGGMELSDRDLAEIAGDNSFARGSGGCKGAIGGGVSYHASSVALVCEVNAFTLNVNALLGIPVTILSGAHANCVGSH